MLLFLWLEINFFVLPSSISSNAINELERKLSAKEAVRARKGVTLFIYDEHMNDIIIRSFKEIN